VCACGNVCDMVVVVMVGGREGTYNWTLTGRCIACFVQNFLTLHETLVLLLLCLLIFAN
jgi:hypothetical protein